MTIFRTLLTAAMLLALVFSGCAKKDSSDGASSGATAGTSASTSAGSGTAAKAKGESGRAIEITANDQIKFSTNEIRAKAGEVLTVTLVNVGTMPKMSMGHNWVLLKEAKDVDAFVNDAAMAAATDYIPAARKEAVYAHTKMLGPKERDAVTFNAPQKPGRYPFLCSFPGHYQVGMKGDLIVE